MSWRTSKVALTARSIGRRLGLNRRLAVLINGSGYETKYENDFFSQLRAGDCVWDVGANVGYYTRQFAEKVGSKGQVFAFEPSPTNFSRLQAETVALENVQLINVGLGNEEGQLSFLQGSDDLGATSRIVAMGVGGTVVEVRTGNQLIDSRNAFSPNAIKIDVEGFELEVLQGMGAHLGNFALRAIGIEVHFSILCGRGMQDAPKQIERHLELNGFHVQWPDASHILALRSA